MPETPVLCPSCQKQYLVSDYDPSKPYRCRVCSAVVTPLTYAPTEVLPPSSADDPLPEEVDQAKKDPSKRFGRFLLVKELGRGGMGVVTKAWDEELGRWVAIKFVTPGIVGDEDLARFKREAKVAANLDHPNIAPIYDVGDGGGRRYIVMKFVDGATLQHAGLVGIPAIVAAIRDAARAVGHAHAAGIIHRDLKPQNLMIDSKGRVYVMDFGLAKPMDTSTGGLTKSTAVLGTPAYMAPEQARGHMRELDARTDVYSLGVTLWTLLAGRPPHVSDTSQDLMIKIATEDAPAIRTVRSDVPAALDAILAKAMARDKNARFGSAKEFADALDAFLAGGAPVPTKRRSAVPVLLAIVVLLAAGFFVWKPRRRAPTPRPQPAPADPAPTKEKVEDKYAEAAALARAEKDPAKAIDLWKKAEKLAKDPGEFKEVRDALRNLSAEQVYGDAMRRGWEALGKTRPKDALEAFEEALRAKPEDTEAQSGREKALEAMVEIEYLAAMTEGQAAEKRKEWAKAKAAYAKALEKRKGDRAAQDGIARMEKALIPDVIEVAALRMKLLRIAAGSFRMGEADAGSDEKPEHPVILTRDFWMLTTEVTQAQWKSVMGSAPSSFKGDDLPVESVTWEDAQAFVKKLNEKHRQDGRTFSLPTEAEWEYACRAGSTRPWCFGKDEVHLEENAWFARTSGLKTQPVAGKKANAWGLYDMHGNVYEWCGDWFGPYADGEQKDPKGPANGTKRALRGGGFSQAARYTTCSFRIGMAPNEKASYVGFRVVLR